MQLPTSLLAFALGSLAMLAAPERQEEPRGALRHYSLGKNQLALGGYDPVAYFEVGGGQPKRGDKSIEAQHRGVRYRFVSERHREIFLAAPERFEPAYGGWCAWAMVDGSKTEVDPKSYLIEHGRLLLFYDGLFGDTRKSWLATEANTLHPKADGAWTRLTAESAPIALYTHAHRQGVAIDGADPLALSRGEFVAGDPRFAWSQGGLAYHFASAEAREKFAKAPLTVRFGGWSPHSLVAGEPVAGKPQHAIVEQSNLILFASAGEVESWATDRLAVESAAQSAWNARAAVR